jgi:hypothetical protein
LSMFVLGTLGTWFIMWEMNQDHAPVCLAPCATVALSFLSPY